MILWTTDELNRIGSTEELRIAVKRMDGTFRKPVIIWVVRVGNNLYVRSYRGRGGSWFRAALTTHEGQIKSGGVVRDVALIEEKDPGINDLIDAAYLAKYGHYPQYVAPMVTDEVRSTTFKLLPLEA